MAIQKPTKKPKAKKRSSATALSGKSFTRLSLSAFVGTALSIIIVAAAFYALILIPQAKQKAQTQAKAYVNHFGNQLDISINQLQLSVEGISKNENLGKLLAAQTSAALKEKENELKTNLPYAMSVHLYPKGTAQVNREVFPPISFAALDMIQKAEAGETVAPEVQKFDERLLLTMAKNIVYQGKTSGVIYATFEFKDITKKITTFDATEGYLSLTQTFANGKTQQILQAGSTQWQKSAYTADYDNTVGSWKTRFNMAPPLEDTSMFSLFYAIAVILMILAVFLFISFSLRGIELAMRKDSTILLALSEQIAEKNHLHRNLDFKFNTLFFASIGHTMERLLEEILADDLKQKITPQSSQYFHAPLTSEPAPRATDHVDALLKQNSQSNENEHDSTDNEDADSTPYAESIPEQPAAVTHAKAIEVSKEIFRAYDIRGIVGKTLNPETVRLIGHAIGSEALGTGQDTVIVARDGRLSGPELIQSLIEGVTRSGCKVINIGMVPTPMLYFACNTLSSKSGVMLTGSHNPADYNGLKIVINGETLSGERIQDLYQRIVTNNFIEGEGSVEEQEIKQAYFNQVLDDVVLATNIKVVVDCGNGVAGMAAPELLSALGCDVVPLYCDVDGHFPNHHPDPSKPENLAKLIETVIETHADIGLAFDGDGDRLGVVSNKGKIIWADRLMMLYAKDLLVRTPGADIIFDVKCSRNLSTLISELGGRPMMWKTGHSFIKAKLKETNAALAGEMSGHIFFNDRWFGFDDALYSAARLLEILTTEQGSSDEIFATLPDDISTPEINIQVPENIKFGIIDELQKKGQFGKGKITTIDGIRVDFPKAWGLVRASNTTPCLVARFEAQNEEALGQIKELFRKQLLDIDSNLQLTF